VLAVVLAVGRGARSGSRVLVTVEPTGVVVWPSEAAALSVAVGSSLSLGLETTACTLEAVAVNRSGRSEGKRTTVAVGSALAEFFPGSEQQTKATSPSVTTVLADSTTLRFTDRYLFERHRPAFLSGSSGTTSSGSFRTAWIYWLRSSLETRPSRR
jgi:hypothetical protein